MSIPTAELREFHQFLADKLRQGAANLSPEEVLDEWRQLNPDGQVSSEELVAIQEALADVAAGDQGIPFEQFDSEFRQRHNLPAKP